MSTKKLILAGVGLFLIGAACGYYALPAKVVTKTQVQVVEKIVKDTSTDASKHVKTVTVEDKKPTGEVITTTTQTQDDDTKTKVAALTNTQQDTATSKEIDYSKNSISINVLMADKFGAGGGVTYGAYINKKLIGPIQIGAFGLLNGTVGGSLGVSF